MSEQDTREQVIDCGTVIPEFSRVPKFDISEWVTRTAEEIADLREKLARQAEVTGELELRCKGLESERDELKAFADRVRGAVIKGNDLTLFGADYVPADACYAALRAADAIARNLRDEVNQLRKVVQTQADSFAKLERELAMAKEEQQ